MRKSIVTPENTRAVPAGGQWFDLEQIAHVEITSEDSNFPIENALGSGETTGWRASTPGPQVIRLIFDGPQTIRQIQVHFVERTVERSQEFAIFAGSAGELREVVRQQWSFSPQGSTEEIEDYSKELDGIGVLELRIDPDRSHDPKLSKAFASLQSLKVA
ncbi:MAG TPA: hypothetical protein VNU92_06065 [Edaphobacter sp.]|nr:hypothetical protein [Edaphobacter sp.]